MSNKWPMMRLGEVLEQYQEYIESPESKTYPKLSVKLYGKGVVLDEPIDGALLKMKRHQIAQAGQVILSEIWGKKGAIGIVPSQGEGALCTSHFFLFNINTDKIERAYLHWLLLGNYLQDQLNKEAKGTTGYAATRPKHLLLAEIPLPPLEEQRRITARIEELSAKIEEVRELKRQIQNQTGVLLSSIHNDFAKGEKAKLDEVIELFENREKIRSDGDYPQVGVRGFGAGLFAKETITGDMTAYKEFNRLYDGALVLSQVKGWEGAVAVCCKELAGRYVSPEYRTFRCIPEKALPEYFSFIISTEWFWTKLAKLTRGVGGRRERIKTEFFLDLTIPMPTITAQREALKLFYKIAEMKALQTSTLKEVETLLPSILDKAFKGEL